MEPLEAALMAYQSGHKDALFAITRE